MKRRPDWRRNMSAAVRRQVSDPTVEATAAAHAVTNSVLDAMARQMIRCGIDADLEAGENRELRRSVWLDVLRRIDRQRSPMKSVVDTAVARAPAPPTRAAALIASGLLDIGKGIESLSAALAEAVANELNGSVHASVVRGAIKRAIVDLLNGGQIGEAP